MTVNEGQISIDYVIEVLLVHCWCFLLFCLYKGCCRRWDLLVLNWFLFWKCYSWSASVITWPVLFRNSLQFSSQSVLILNLWWKSKPKWVVCLNLDKTWICVLTVIFPNVGTKYLILLALFYCPLQMKDVSMCIAIVWGKYESFPNSSNNWFWSSCVS